MLKIGCLLWKYNGISQCDSIYLHSSNRDMEHFAIFLVLGPLLFSAGSLWSFSDGLIDYDTAHYLFLSLRCGTPIIFPIVHIVSPSASYSLSLHVLQSESSYNEQTSSTPFLSLPTSFWPIFLKPFFVLLCLLIIFQRFTLPFQTASAQNPASTIAFNDI